MNIHNLFATTPQQLHVALTEEPTEEYRPVCACPVISAFLQAWNDALPNDAERDRLLKPLVTRLVNTKHDAATEERRSLMAADWLIRVNTPAWLRLAGLTVHADALTSLPEIIDMKQISSIRGPIEAARQDAAAAWWDAAWWAARDAVWDAAREDAAGNAALVAVNAAGNAAGAAAAGKAAGWAVAGDAAWWAARDAVWDAAREDAADNAALVAVNAAGNAAGAAAAGKAAGWAVAGAAAWAAARWAATRAAGRAKLQPVVEELQQSALQLVERMIAA